MSARAIEFEVMEVDRLAVMLKLRAHSLEKEAQHWSGSRRQRLMSEASAYLRLSDKLLGAFARPELLDGTIAFHDHKVMRRFLSVV